MEPARILECDTLVIGSGMSGCCAAIQAARGGGETILVEKDEVLGGNSGPNLGVEIRGAHWYNPYGVEVGIVQELEEEEAYTSASTPVRGMKYNISRRREAVLEDTLKRSGVTVLKSHYARRPVMEGNRIAAVETEDLAAFATRLIKVRHTVIDASGDGHIAAEAGAEYTVAPEAKSVYGERSASDSAPAMIQGTSLTALVCKTDHEIRFVPPDNTPPYVPRVWDGNLAGFYNELLPEEAARFDDGAPVGTMRFLYVTEAGGDRDTIADAAAINTELTAQMWSYWNHIKNSPGCETSRNWDMLWISPKAGRRQSRRFYGDHVLTQTEVEAGAVHGDDIAYGGHNLDDHLTDGRECDIRSHSVPPMYGIPYRCCYSRNIENLLIGGRLISASHIAHSSSRTMRTGAAIGQGLGVAAELCRRYGCSPRAVYRDHLAELRLELLRLDGSLPPVKLADPDDLAPAATVSATAELRFNDQEPGYAVPLLVPAGAVLFDWPERLEKVALHLANPSGDAISGKVRVLHDAPPRLWALNHEFRDYGRTLPDAGLFRELAAREFTVPAGFSGWREIVFASPVECGRKNQFFEGDRLLIAVEPGDTRLCWNMAKRRNETAVAAAYESHRDAWLPFAATPALRLYPEIPNGEAVNVVNGFNRRFGSAPGNMWQADFSGEPLTLRLKWKSPQKISRVVLFFDDLEPGPDDNPCRCGKRFSEKLVSDYSITAATPEGPREVAAVADNRRRRMEHRFPEVETDTLEIHILKVRGCHQARLYQVNVYNTPSAWKQDGTASPVSAQ